MDLQVRGGLVLIVVGCPCQCRRTGGYSSQLLCRGLCTCQLPLQAGTWTAQLATQMTYLHVRSKFLF